MRGGHITAKGYRRIPVGNRPVMEHDHVWEQHHGRLVPPDHDIHHVDGDKLNNDPSNLRLVTKLEHKRIHSGCELRDGIWWKPCSICHDFKPVTDDHWYFTREGWVAYGRCRPCHIAAVCEARRLRKLRRAVAS